MKRISCLSILSGLVAVGLLAGCNNETTRKDVASADQKVAKEQQKLDEAKRNEAHVANKPNVDQSQLQNAHDNVRNQEDRVQKAESEADKRKQELGTEQARDMFLVDCKAATDLANRAIEKLETKKNAATDQGKTDLDNQIKNIKDKREALQKEINNIRSADEKKWSDYKPAAQKAMDDLNQATKGAM